MPKFVHDQRTGAGYGFTGRNGFQTNSTKSGSRFPYNEETEEPEEEESDDFLNLKAQINNKVSYGNLARPPETFSRTDRFTMSKNRLDLSENSETPAKILIGLVPFPMHKFDGPVVGGDSLNPSYRTGPGRIDGSPYGWTKGAMSPMLPTTDSLPRFMDAIDPELRGNVAKKLKIARLK